MWLKLYENSKLKSACTDKWAVRDYVKSLGLAEHLIPVLQVADDVEEIVFEQLPKRFVMKCTHGSGYNLIILNKKVIRFDETKKQLAKWLNTDYSLINCEPHYRKIQPRIMIEQFLGEQNGQVPTDIKIHCFHGKPELIELIVGRYSNEKYTVSLTPTWEPVHYYHMPETESLMERPKTLEKMLEIAQKLSKPFTYVRVDLYDVGEKIYFGELTFTPSACLEIEMSEPILKQLGDFIQLPIGNKEQVQTTSRIKNLWRKRYG